MKKIFVMGFQLLILNLSAQNRFELSGTILSKNTNEPVNGVTISLLKNNKTTSSTENGKFNISLNIFPDTLILTHIGFQKRRIFLTEKDLSLVIYLEEIEKTLEEIKVNSGYQDIPRERSAASFEKISNDQLNLRTGTDILSRLQGVSTLLFDVDGDRPPITLRGISSVYGNKAPLIVLDNFPYEGDITNINPNDVESITFLKDAAAASIWGVRAGNGVLVITTKKGQFNQRLAIDVNFNVTTIKKPDLFYLPQISSSEYIDVQEFLYSKGFYNSQINNTTSRPALSPVIEILLKATNNQLTAAEATAQINALRGHDVRTDYSKYLYNNAVNQQYSLSLKGGTNVVSYLYSIGFDKNLNELSSKYNRLNFRFDNTFRLTKKLQILTGLIFTKSQSNSGAPDYSPSSYPYTQLADADGKPLPVAKYRQGYIDTAGGGRLLDWRYFPLEDYKYTSKGSSLISILANAGIQYKVTNDLSVLLKYQYEAQQVDQQTLQGLQSFYARDLINKFSQINFTTGAVKYNIPKGGIMDRTIQDIQSHNARVQIVYNHIDAINSINILAGAEIREIKAASSNYRRYGYDEDILTISNVDLVNPYPNYISKSNSFIPSNNGSIPESKLLNHYVSVYANGSYTLKSKYTLSASIRRDGSNLFGVKTNNKWKPLWSVGTAWNISNESFYSSNFFPYLRLRVTYGYNGNVSSSLSAETTLSMRSGAPTTSYPYAIVDNVSNPELRWEKTAMLNTGLDFTTRDKILSGSIEYYKKRGTDLYGSWPIDYTTGAGQYVLKNIINMKGYGIDISLNAKILDKGLKWTAGILFNYNSSKVTKAFLATAPSSTFVSDGVTIRAMQGLPVYLILSYQWAGLDTAGNPLGVVNGVPSKDYAAIRSDKTKVNDLVYNGSATPTYYGSFNNTFSWKNFSLTASVSYKMGYSFRRQSVDYQSLLLGNTIHADFSKRWQHPGDEQTTFIPSMIYPNDNSRDFVYRYSSVLVEKGDHIRFQFVSVNFLLTKKMWKKLPAENIQLYMNAANLGIIWRANNYKIDPDYPASIPPSKTFSIGIKAAL